MEAMKIMLVDDEERLLYTTRKLFEKIGIDVITCASGREALDHLKETRVHVVFLDIRMPDMDGLEVLREIRKNHPLVEVVILTGHATMDVAVEGLKLGAMDFLVKPLSMKDLLGKAEEAYEKVRRHESKIQMARSAEPLAGAE